MRTELHFHLLPGVDDGPTDDAESIELARLAVADGTSTIVTTPHVNAIDIAELPQRVDRLRAVLRNAGVKVEVRQGGELSPGDVSGATQAELEAIAHGPQGRRWVLLEAPLSLSQSSLYEAADELRARGFGVLIAHPERSPGYSIDALRDQVGLGAMLQINASALAGGHGARAGHAAVVLAQSGLPFVLASDAHSAARPPLLGEGARALTRAGLAPDRVRDAVDLGPARLLEEGLATVAVGDPAETSQARAPSTQRGLASARARWIRRRGFGATRSGQV